LLFKIVERLLERSEFCELLFERVVGFGHAPVISRAVDWRREFSDCRLSRKCSRSEAPWSPRAGSGQPVLLPRSPAFTARRSGSADS
jgi:hypothetical protein